MHTTTAHTNDANSTHNFDDEFGDHVISSRGERNLLAVKLDGSTVDTES